MALLTAEEALKRSVENADAYKNKMHEELLEEIEGEITRACFQGQTSIMVPLDKFGYGAVSDYRAVVGKLSESGYKSFVLCACINVYWGKRNERCSA